MSEVSRLPVHEPFDLRRIDLNLVLPLHALLEERSVTAAAHRLGVSQPAASQSLSKLRKHFGNDLLRREGREYHLTPLAAGLRGSVERVVHDLGLLLSAGAVFDPAENSREYTILASDYGAAVLGQPLVRRLAARAPSVRLIFSSLPDGGTANLHEVFAAVDGVILPSGMNPPGEWMPLYDDSWCCIVDESLADEARAWSAEEFTARGWVATAVVESVPAQGYLRHAGIDIDVVIRAQTFTAVPYLVSGSPHVGVLHRRHARMLAAATRTVIIDPPWRQPPVPMVMFYDGLRAQDPAVRWFLDEVAVVAAQLAEPS
jgi:DNA-binding transcriptional LysR family regulator